MEPGAGVGPVRARRALSPWLFWGLLLALTLLLRLLAAESRGIWQDEGLTLYQVRLPFAEILANRIPVAEFDTQNTVPPFYFLLLGAWGRLAGYGLWSLRLFSIFCSLLMLPLLYRVGHWLAGPRAGQSAALLAALSPLYLWYAQELRMYTFLLLPATLSMGLLWRWQRETSPAAQWRWALLYVLTAAAMAWTHYLAFLLIGAQLLWLTLLLLRRRPRLLLTVLALFLLLALPLIPFGVRRLLAGQERDFFFLPIETIVGNLMHSLAFGPPFFVSRLEEIAWLLPLAWALLGLGLWQAWRRGRGPLVLLLGSCLVLPVLALYALSYVKPLYQNARHLIVVSPAFYLLWALGLQRLAELRRWLPLLVLPFLAYGWGLSIEHYFSNDGSVVQKNDLRPLFEYLAEHYVPGDVVALNDPVLQHSLEYFAPGVPWTILPAYAEPISEEQTIPLYEQVARQYERVWYVYGPPDSSFDTWRHVYDWFHGHHNRLGVVEFPGQTIIAVVQFDTQGALIQEVPHPAAESAEARFPVGIHYRGLFGPLKSAAAGQRTVVETLWYVATQPNEELQFVLRLADEQGRVWYQEQLPPFGGLHLTTHWQQGQYLRMPLFLRPPATLPPGPYRLELLPITPEGRALFPEGSDHPIRLGTLDLTRATEAGSVEGVRLGDALRVVAAPLPPRLLPAPTLSLSLQVQVIGEGAIPDTFELQVQTMAGQRVATLPFALAEGLPRAADGSPLFPPAAWRPGDRFEVRFERLLPATLEGRYQLSLVAWQRGAILPVNRFNRWFGLRRSEALPLGTIEIEPRQRRTAIPPFRHESGALWGEQVRLLGYTQEPEPARSDQPIHLQLVWQPLAPTDRPYKVFLHLQDEQGAVVAGADAFFDVPSMAWESGEIVLSDHDFPAGQVPPGRYTLLVGLYYEATQERLPVDAPNFAVPLSTLDVEAAP